MLTIVKLALRITTNAFDDELNLLISDCLAELSGLGVTNLQEGTTYDPQVQTTVIAYCKWKFGDSDTKSDWERIYHVKVAQLQTMSGHTDWGDVDG